MSKNTGCISLMHCFTWTKSHNKRMTNKTAYLLKIMIWDLIKQNIENTTVSCSLTKLGKLQNYTRSLQPWISELIQMNYNDCGLFLLIRQYFSHTCISVTIKWKLMVWFFKSLMLRLKNVFNLKYNVNSHKFYYIGVSFQQNKCKRWIYQNMTYLITLLYRIIKYIVIIWTADKNYIKFHHLCIHS